MSTDEAGTILAIGMVISIAAGVLVGWLVARRVAPRE